MTSTDHSVVASDDSPRSIPQTANAYFNFNVNYGDNMNDNAHISGDVSAPNNYSNVTSVPTTSGNRRPRTRGSAIEPRASQLSEMPAPEAEVVSSVRNSRINGEILPLSAVAACP